MVAIWKCPACGKEKIPKGMHCYECLCDILCEQPFGTTKKLRRRSCHVRKSERISHSS